MNFDNEKKQTLAKIDKSKKKSIDKDVLHIVNLLNKHKNYYTTSSCSGRIMLIGIAPSGRKCDAEWLYAEHGKASPAEVMKVLGKAKNDAWFKQEAAIFHVACRTVHDAMQLLMAARGVGFKRSGMIAIGKRTVVEIVSTEMMAAIVAKKGKVIVDGAYLKALVKEANERMKRNKKKIAEFYRRIRKI
jgi:tRNA wybutosine-synthesizing protein 3